MQDGTQSCYNKSEITTLTTELEETKHKLLATRETNTRLEICINRLKDELQDNRRKLREKVKEVHHKQLTFSHGKDDIKFVSVVKDVWINKEQEIGENGHQVGTTVLGHESKKRVKFASPSSLTNLIILDKQEDLSLTKKNKDKKKAFIAWLSHLKKQRHSPSTR